MKITARPGLARLLEEAADAGRAAADEHLDEARAGGGEEVDPGLGGDRPRQHRLAGAGRAVEQHAARRLGAERGEAVRFAQPLGHVHQLVLGRVDALDLVPEHRRGLARLHRFRLGRADRAAASGEEDEQQAGHEEDPKTGYQSKKNSWISVASIRSVRVGLAEYKSTSVQGA